jgi:hypothetical protein
VFVAFGQSPHLAWTFGRGRARQPIAGRRDGFSEARQRTDDAAHEQAGDQQHGGQHPGEAQPQLRGQCLGFEAWRWQHQPPALAAGDKPDPQAAALSRTAVPEQHRFAEALGKFVGKAAGKGKLRLMPWHAVAVRAHLQALLASVGGAQDMSGFVVQSRQDDLQQAHLTGEQLHGLTEVRVAAKVPDQGKGGDLGDGNHRDHQQHRAAGQR